MADLENYKQKRNFDITNEPVGAKAKIKSGQNFKENLKFVVQHHMSRREHFDFRLEHNGVLLSWAVPKGPSYNPQDKRLAVMVEDHPLEYRNFEGVIPQGQYGAGAVMIWDEGYWLSFEDVSKSIKDGSLKFALYGKRLIGVWNLVRMKIDGGNNWLLIKENDAYAKDSAGISEFIVSVRTGRTMEEIENKKTGI